MLSDFIFLQNCWRGSEKMCNITKKQREDTDVVRKFSKAPHGRGAKKKTSEMGSEIFLEVSENQYVRSVYISESRGSRSFTSFLVWTLLWA